MTCWRRSTRLTALFRKLATLSLADAMRTPSRPAIIEGAITAVTRRDDRDDHDHLDQGAAVGRERPGDRGSDSSVATAISN